MARWPTIQTAFERISFDADKVVRVDERLAPDRYPPGMPEWAAAALTMAGGAVEFVGPEHWSQVRAALGFEADTPAIVANPEARP